MLMSLKVSRESTECNSARYITSICQCDCQLKFTELSPCIASSLHQFLILVPLHLQLSLSTHTDGNHLSFWTLHAIVNNSQPFGRSNLYRYGLNRLHLANQFFFSKLLYDLRFHHRGASSGLASLSSTRIIDDKCSSSLIHGHPRQWRACSSI
jgi:hypothetical protein